MSNSAAWPPVPVSLSIASDRRPMSAPLATEFHPPCDVLVVGGGVSGSMAALAAARTGARVLLVEEHGFPGGSLTAMGVGPMMSFHNPNGRQVVRGLAEELIERLAARGASPGHIADTTTYCSTVTPFDSEEMKVELETMLAEAGVQVLFHTQLAAVTAEDGRVKDVTLCNKAGLTRVHAAVFVDATGDADLAARAGVRFVYGRDGGAAQPMTMNLKLANVDTAAVRAYARAHPEDFLWHPHGPAEGLRRLESSPRISLAGFVQAWRAAQARGEVDVPRDHVLFFETAVPGVVIVNTSRVIGLDATDPRQLSTAERIGRRQCQQIFRFLRAQAPGFASAVRMDSAPKIGVRETRHIVGRYTLTGDDVVEARAFPDAIALGGYPIDIHSPAGDTTLTRYLQADAAYEIPLRTLLPAGFANLLVVGRAISATHEASAALRVSPIAMAIGQAGGVAAAEAAARGVSVDAVPFAAIRERLLAQGAVLPAERPVEATV